MPTPSYHITCTQKSLIAPNVYEIRFTKPAGFTFKPGQFILFDVPLKEDPSDIQTRAFSIASMPSESDLLLVVKLKKGGRASVWIEELLKGGSEVRIQGPFGLFLLKEPEDGYIFVATGAGIAPFRSQILSSLREKNDTRPMHLLFGVRAQPDFFWMQEFRKIAEEFPNFRFHPTLTGDDPSWTGLKGRVQSHLSGVMHGLNQVGIYICGAPEMVQDVKKTCLEELGVPKGQVHGEGYI